MSPIPRRFLLFAIAFPLSACGDAVRTQEGVVLGATITPDNWDMLFADGDLFSWGTPEMVNKAIASYSAGVVVNSSDSIGRTPLMYAAMDNPNPEIVAILINAGASLEARDFEGATALLLASSFNDNPEVVSVLVEAGADLEAKNHAGQSSLMLWLEYGLNTNVVSRLLRHGADFKDIESLDLLLRAVVRDSDIDSASHLIEAGANLEARAEIIETTPLLEAAERANSEMISFLINAGAEIEAQDVLGMTCLLRAAAYNPNPQSVVVLLESGANVHARSRGLTVLDCVKQNERLEGSEAYERIVEALGGEE